MSDLDTNNARSRLESRRDEIRGELDRLATELESLGVEQELENGGLGNHMAEDGSSVQEQERNLAVSADLRDLLGQIDGALGRLDDGSYGTCQRCGRPVAPERLEAFPYVAHCIECQSIVERQQGSRMASATA